MKKTINMASLVVAAQARLALSLRDDDPKIATTAAAAIVLSEAIQRNSIRLDMRNESSALLAESIDTLAKRLESSIDSGFGVMIDTS